MVEKINFKGYKSFKNNNSLELKPLTIVFGKNSAGKSAIARLPLMIEDSLNAKTATPINYSLDGVELGIEYRDLFYDREFQETIAIELCQGSASLKSEITNAISGPVISKWSLSKGAISDEEIVFDSDALKSKKDEFQGIVWSKYRDEIQSKFSLRTDFIGPFRLSPPRIFYPTNEDVSKFGRSGENVYQILIQEPEILDKVSNWYRENFEGWGLLLNKIDPYYEFRLTRENSKSNGINLCDVGQGMSQALPIITKSFMRNKEKYLTIIEQPELHLHPAAHGSLAELMSKSARNLGNMFLIETHSKNFILRVRTLIAKGELKKEDVNLYFVNYRESENCSELKQIYLDSNGDVDFWPTNVFDESYEEAKELLIAQKATDSHGR